MNILLSGYFDRNFGDDMMIRITAYYLAEHDFYLDIKEEETFLPFENIENIYNLNRQQPERFDFALTVIGSGFMSITYSWIPHFLKEEMLRRARTKRIPTAVIGCNIGPIQGWISKFLVHKRLASYDFVTVRDAESLLYLYRYFPRKQCAYYPDLVFSMPDEWIPKATGEACLGISAYGRAGADTSVFFRSMAATADRYIKRTGKKVLLFAFDLGHEDDLAAAHRIKALSEHQEMIEIIAHEDNGDHILSHLQRCARILSVRFHMMVTAVRLGIPFVPIAYSDKTRHVLRNMGYDGKIFDIHELNAQELDGAVRGCAAFRPEDGFFERAVEHIRFLERGWIEK